MCPNDPTSGYLSRGNESGSGRDTCTPRSTLHYAQQPDTERRARPPTDNCARAHTRRCELTPRPRVHAPRRRAVHLKLVHHATTISIKKAKMEEKPNRHRKLKKPDGKAVGLICVWRRAVPLLSPGDSAGGRGDSHRSPGRPFCSCFSFESIRFTVYHELGLSFKKFSSGVTY